MATYKTPGVYAQEISNFPPSVAEVETAIPAFIGYTERADKKGVSLLNVPTRIKSMLEFRTWFGEAPLAKSGSIQVSLNGLNVPISVNISQPYILFNSMRLFFDNGGGDCYIISVGDYEANIAKPNFLAGIDALKKYDEPTMIVLPEAIKLSAADLYSVQQQALMQCQTLGDRVAIFDLLESNATNPNFDMYTGVQDFRNSIGINALKYGAAYVPHLQSSLDIAFGYASIQLIKSGLAVKLVDLMGGVPAAAGQVAQLKEDRKTTVALSTAAFDTTLTALEATKNKINLINAIEAALVFVKDIHASMTNAELKNEFALSSINSSLEQAVKTLRQLDLDYYKEQAGPPPFVDDPLLITEFTTVPTNIYDVTTVVKTSTHALTVYSSAGIEGADEAARLTNAKPTYDAAFATILNSLPPISNSIIDNLIAKNDNLTPPVVKLDAIYAKDKNSIDALVQAAATATTEYNGLATTGEDLIMDRMKKIKTIFDEIIKLNDRAAVPPLLDDMGLINDVALIVNPGGRFSDVLTIAAQYDLDYHDNTSASTPLNLIIPTNFSGYTLPTGITTPNASVYSSVGVVGSTENIRASNSAAVFFALLEQANKIVSEIKALLDKRVIDLERDLLTTSSIYANVAEAIRREGSVLPPSPAIAGIYTSVDNVRGVWKSPANVSLNSVIGGTTMIDDFDQEDLNVDTTAGKSINAIRSFTGRGTLVWGARTLSGNDNEWRYISVRRFFNMVEESLKKSTQWAVFEPNDARTWSKVKSMIENYLYQKWSEGALMGVKEEHAYYVKIGLGETMRPEDVLEGRMIVEIGMSVVRPAEFIILKFSHMLPQS